MRVAIFSDAHGNLTALNAVLEDIKRMDLDAAIFAGDLCVFGPRPAECVDSLLAAGCAALYGNTDGWVLGWHEPPARYQELAAWTGEQLNSAQRAWLDGLPFEIRIEPPDGGDTLLVVHANPQDVDQLIFPPEAEQRRRYNEVRQPDSDLAAIMDGCEARHVAFGHLHLPFVRLWRTKTLYNISSVSMPGDGDGRAKYGVFSWSGEDWSFEHHFVAYDASGEADAFRHRRPPGWEAFAESIKTLGYVPQNV
ncbi:MAG: metallophosphoesterase family protein [Candidatus Promineifilaceae bacterium]